MDENTQLPPQNPPPPPVTPPVPPPPPPKNYSGILIGILLLAIAILVGMELDETTFISNVRLYLGAKPTPAPTSFLTPSPIPDPTADWKTCTNTTVGFSIKYPANFAFDTITCNYAINDYSLVENINVVTFYDDFQKNWLLNITSEKSGLDVKQWIESKNLCPNTLCSGIAQGPIAHSSRFDIDSHYAETDVVTNIAGTIFKFTLNARNPGVSASADIKNVLDQILTTFKFVDQTPPPTTYTCPPSGWVDCMPGPTAKPECSAAAMEWYRANCPDFKGGAL